MAMDPNSEFSNYVVREIETSLDFEEFSAFRMIHSWSGVIEATADIRFYQRRRGWTGKGIEASPRVRASVGKRPLSARRHGPVYREGSDEYYLVDLGERIARDTRVRVETESLYVDEEGTFRPLLSAAVYPDLERLRLTVITPMLIDAIYIFEDGEVPLDPIPHGARFKYERTIPVPPIGIHRISWTWPEDGQFVRNELQ
jgi:hypothetical protein